MRIDNACPARPDERAAAGDRNNLPHERAPGFALDIPNNRKWLRVNDEPESDSALCFVCRHCGALYFEAD